MRGQTTLDFAIGISIFLAIVLFTFGFIPGILDPFDITDSEHPTLADRTADSLAHDTLGSASNPHILDRYCTVAFFDDGGPDLEDCNFEDGDLSERLGFEIGQNAKISITHEDSVVCWTDEVGSDGLSGHEEEAGLTTNCGGGDVSLATGQEPDDGQDTTVSARRTVSLGGEPVQLEVVLW